MFFPNQAKFLFIGIKTRIKARIKSDFRKRHFRFGKPAVAIHTIFVRTLQFKI